MNSDRSSLSTWLRAIPQSRHAPCPLAEMPGNQAIGWGLPTLLEVWGAVELSEAGIRAVSQPAYYFLHSLAAWAETPGAIVEDWSEAHGVDAKAGIAHGASLVHLLERERLARDAAAAPIRRTPVAQILIIRPGDPPRFLVQWDARAGYFQLIGGRQKDDLDWREPIQQTAIREFEEELAHQIRFDDGDFKLALLDAFETEARLSPSFGALTSYHFTFFRACDLAPITLGPADLWVSRAEILSGVSSDGRPIRGDHILPLERRLGQRIDNLPLSFIPDTVT